MASPFGPWSGIWFLRSSNVRLLLHWDIKAYSHGVKVEAVGFLPFLSVICFLENKNEEF